MSNVEVFDSVDVEQVTPPPQVVDVVTVPPQVVEIVAVGFQGPAGPPGPPGAEFEVRSTAVHTTSALADSSAEQSSIVLAKAYRLLSIAMDFPARVRLYDRAAKQVTDLSRALGAAVPNDSGLVFEFAGSFVVLGANLSPQIIGDSMEAVPSTSIPITVTNLSGATRAITITFVYVAIG